MTMPNIDFNSPLMYLLSSFVLLGLYGLLMVVNKLFEDKIVSWFKRIYKKITSHTDINDIKMQEIITNINSDLAVLRNELYGDRATIYEFHNGSEFTSKFPSWKVTNTYERVKPGIPYGKNDFNQVPATLIWDNYLELIFKDISNLEELPNGVIKHSTNLRCKSEGCIFPRKVLKFNILELPFCNIKSLFERQGVEYVIQTPIIDVSGKIIGIVSVEYNDLDDYKEIENQLNPCILCNFAAQVSLIWQMDDVHKITNE